MFNSNQDFPTIPHHPNVPPHHVGPIGRHNIISVIYDSDKLQKVFGDFWYYHVERIANEPPEMKILFALEMGFCVSANSQIVDLLVRQNEEERNRGTSHKFANAALDEDNLQLLSTKLGINKETVSVVLEHAPEGVVSVIIAVAKNN